MHPRLDAIVLVPMFPHTLSSRPIVIEGNSEIKIYVSPTNEFRPLLSCDGQGGVVANPGDWIYIRKRAHPLKLPSNLTSSLRKYCRASSFFNSILAIPSLQMVLIASS